MTADWTHPRIENPACRWDYFADIAQCAKEAFERRRDTYAQLVQAKRITADEARADIEAWRAIAKGWRHIATGEGEMAQRASLDARIAAIDVALTRWFDAVDARDGGMSEAEGDQGALICAVRWWAHREQQFYSAGGQMWLRGHVFGWLTRNPETRTPFVDRKAA